MITSRKLGPILVVLTSISLGACGPGTSEVPAEPDGAHPPKPVTSAALDEAPPTGSTLQPGMLKNSEVLEEVSFIDGSGTVYVAIDCDPMTGGNLVAINPVGFPEGMIISARGQPAFGGDVQALVGPGGSGVGMRQTTLRAEEYTLTIKAGDQTLETRFPGCN